MLFANFKVRKLMSVHVHVHNREREQQKTHK